MSSSFFVDLVGGSAPVLAVLGVFALARRYVKTPERDLADAGEADTRLPSVVLVNLAMGFAGVVVALISHWALISLNRYVASRDAGALLVLYPSPAIWWFFPGFGAVSMAWEITLRIWMKFNPRQANAYRAYSNVKSGFDSTKVLRLLAAGVAGPIGIASLLAVPIHTSLTPNAIVDGRFARLHEDIFPYSEVKELIQFDGYLARDGSFNRAAGVFVLMRDGRRWNSTHTHGPVKVEDPELIRLLVEKTGLNLQHDEIEPR